MIRNSERESHSNTFKNSASTSPYSQTEARDIFYVNLYKNTWITYWGLCLYPTNIWSWRECTKAKALHNTWSDNDTQFIRPLPSRSLLAGYKGATINNTLISVGQDFLLTTRRVVRSRYCNTGMSPITLAQYPLPQLMTALSGQSVKDTWTKGQG